MAEHLELVAEIPKVEKLTVQERLEYAKKRRKQQLKRWERDKDSDYGPPPRKKKLRAKPVTFEPQFMLLDAATRGDVHEVQKMLENGIDPNISNDDGLTALHQACIDGCEEIIDILLDNGAYLDSVDRELWTPLHAAAACGNDDIVEYLLDQGSNIVAINTDGNMPVDLVDEDNEELKEILQAEMEEQGYTEEKLNELKELEEQRMLSDLKKELDADINDSLDLDKKNEHTATLVHIAAANGYVEALEYLLEQGAALDIVDKDGWQPIHGAAVWGNEETIEMLVENGADLDAKTPTGDTPLTLCEEPELQQFLVNLKNQVKANKAKSAKRKRSNSRSLSVKRTSLKDKITISQSEAKAEAILRVHPQLAFLLPKGSEVKNKETAPMDTTPAAATNGEATQNSTTINTNRQEETNHIQDSKTSSLSRVKQKENTNPAPRDSKVNDKSSENKEITERKSSFKITIKTRTVSTDYKKDEQPIREVKPDITLGIDDKHANHRSPTRNQASKPDVTMGTQNTPYNRVPTEPQSSVPQELKPQPDVTMVTGGTLPSTKASTLPRDASISKPKIPNNINNERQAGNGMGPMTYREFPRTGSVPDVAPSHNKDVNKTTEPLEYRNRVGSDSNTLPKSTKTHHAPPPPLPHSSGSLSRSHEPADTSGYPDSFSKRSRSSRENILDVVATGRLASPEHKTVNPDDVKIEPAAGSAKLFQEQPTQPQPKQSQPTQPQPKESQPTQPQPKQSQPTQPQPKIAQPTQPQPKIAQPTQPQPKIAQPTQLQPKQSQPTQPQPKIAQPTQLQPKQSQPTQPKESQPIQPKESQPTQPKESQPTQPKESQPIQPKESQPTQPKESQPTQPKESQPTQPKESQPTQPKESQPTQPKQQVPKETYRRRSSSENMAPIMNAHVKDHDAEPEKKACCVVM